MTVEELRAQRNVLVTERQNLEDALRSGDYKVIKCAEDKARGVSKANLPYDIDALHEERQQKRDRINAIEEAIAEIDAEIERLTPIEKEENE